MPRQALDTMIPPARFWHVPLLIVALACVLPGCQKPEPAEDASSSEPAPASSEGPALPGQESSQSEASQPAAIEPSDKTPQEIIQEMFQAYRTAEKYADNAELHLRGTVQGEPVEQVTPCAVMFEQPNKFSMKVDMGLITCDGTTLWAQTEDLPNQVLKLPAPTAEPREIEGHTLPPRLSIADLYPDAVLASRMTESMPQSFSWVPLQAILLLTDYPLVTFFHDAEKMELTEPARIGDHVCDRIVGVAENGDRVLWIDRETRVLRRFEFPQDDVVGPNPPDGVELTLTAEFHDATFEPELTFAFQPTPMAETVTELTPPGQRLLGKTPGPLAVADLEGDPIPPDAFQGKILVLNFWATWSVPCREILPNVAAVRQQYRDDDQVAFLAVSVDEPKVSNETLKNVLAEWQIDLPGARATGDEIFEQFSVVALPTTVILDPDGVVQDFFPTSALGGPEDLITRIETLRAGNDLYPVLLQQAEAVREGFQRMLEQCIADDLFTMESGIEPRVEEVEIAEATEPATLELNPLWQCTALNQPGNILVLGRDEDTPRLLVVNEFGKIAELDTEGKVLANHPVETLPTDAITHLRTGIDDGQRVFAASTMFSQQVHLLNDQFEKLLAYPPEAAQAPHGGIGDVRLADLDGDDHLELVVGFFDTAGLHCVRMDGTRLWADRAVAQSFQLGVLTPDEQGRRNLLALDSTTDSGALTIIDPDGKHVGKIAGTNQAIIWLAVADLDGDGQSEICTLNQIPGGVQANGVPWQGSQAWSYDLPPGMHGEPIEAIQPGNLLGTEARQWLIASPDSTIHLFAPSGELLDRFTYGEELCGMATAAWDGKNILLISTEKAVTAYEAVKK